MYWDTIINYKCDDPYKKIKDKWFNCHAYDCVVSYKEVVIPLYNQYIKMGK